MLLELESRSGCARCERERSGAKIVRPYVRKSGNSGEKVFCLFGQAVKVLALNGRDHVACCRILFFFVPQRTLKAVTDIEAS